LTATAARPPCGNRGLSQSLLTLTALNRCILKKTSMRLFESFLGLLLFAIAAIGFCAVIRVPLGSLHLMPFFFLPVGILGTAIMTFGAKDAGAALSSVRYFFFTPKVPVDTAKCVAVLGFMLASCYAQGGLLFVIEILSSVRLAGMETVKEGVLMRSIYAGVCTLLAPLIISEALLRPLRARIEILGKKS
jgi:hypothetical protein